MSTAFPFLSELHGVQYGFVGCKAAEDSRAVEPRSDASNATSVCQPAQKAVAGVGQDNRTPAVSCSPRQPSETAARVPQTAARVPQTAARAPEGAACGTRADGVEATQTGTTDALNPPHNRIAQVREQQGISQRTMARRLCIDLKSYQAMERPEADLRHSQLVALQVALEVPMVDLLEDSQTLSRPVAERAKMIKVMKTAAALRETPSNARIERMVQTLCEQLVDLMPELAEVSSWPQYGSRRGSSAIGRALAQQISVADLGLPE